MLIFDNLTLVVLSWMYFAHHNLLWLGLLNGAFLLAFNEDNYKTKWKMYIFSILGIISFVPIGAYFAIPHLASLANANTAPSIFFAELWLGCSIFSWVSAFLWLRVGVRKLNVLSEFITAKSELERNKKTDVREIHKFMPEKALDFDPLKYIDKSKGVFLGLDENERPVYIEFGNGTSAPHIQVVGTTGAGKGVSLGVMASQFMERGEAVFFCDPKDDEWAPSVMFDAAKRQSKPYYYINLNRPNGPQFNLMEGATDIQAFELFQAGFSLVDRGDASDFYGIDDRFEADAVADMIAKNQVENITQNIAQNGFTIAQAYTASLGRMETNDGSGKKFYGKLREMAKVPSINAESGGMSLARVVEEGGCVYIVGSMRNDIIRTVQRMLLVRLIQLAEERDRMKGELRKICIVLDEVKYYLSKPAQEALGAARDKGVHLIIAHQSLGDLKDCTKDMNPDAVVDAVVENCRIKICYKVMSPVTAEWLAAMSGTIQVDDETRTVKRNLVHTETVDNERSIRQAERYFMDENMLMNLQPSVSVLYGSGLAKFVSIRPLKVPKSPLAVKIALAKGGAAKTAADKLAELGAIGGETVADLHLPDEEVLP